MKSFSTLVEAAVATVVIVVCLWLPEVLGLPSWTWGLFMVPAVYYLGWRFGVRCSRRMIFWYVIGVGLFIFITHLLPSEWRHWLLPAVLVGWLLFRKDKRVDTQPFSSDTNAASSAAGSRR